MVEISKNTILWIVIVVLLIATIFLTFKGSSSTGNAINNGKIDMTGWTENEKMNYEMHGTVPARAGVNSASTSSGGMVGG